MIWSAYAAVFYLPDGKYRIAVYAFRAPEELRFVRWHGMVKMVHPED